MFKLFIMFVLYFMMCKARGWGNIPKLQAQMSIWPCCRSLIFGMPLPYPGALPYNFHWANVITDFAPRVKICPLRE